MVAFDTNAVPGFLNDRLFLQCVDRPRRSGNAVRRRLRAAHCRRSLRLSRLQSPMRALREDYSPHYGWSADRSRGAMLQGWRTVLRGCFNR